MNTEKLVRAVYGNESLKEGLRVVDIFAVLLGCYDFFFLAVRTFTEDVLRGVRLCVLLAVPFLLVSGVRYLLRTPRPYDVYDLPGVGGKHIGSFPSRHAFSIFLLGTVSFLLSPLLGAVTLVFGVLLAVCRVLLGLHFVRDVAAGAAIGVLSGVAAILILTYC